MRTALLTAFLLVTGAGCSLFGESSEVQTRPVLGLVAPPYVEADAPLTVEVAFDLPGAGCWEVEGVAVELDVDRVEVRPTARFFSDRPCLDVVVPVDTAVVVRPPHAVGALTVAGEDANGAPVTRVVTVR